MVRRILGHYFSLLHVDHVILGARWNYKNVISPYYRLYYIDEGEGEISDLKTSLKLEAGYLYIIPSYTFCNLACSGRLGQYFIQFFEESADGISLFSQNRQIMKLNASDHDISNFKRLLEINPGRGINRSDNPKVYEKDIFYKEYQELNNRQGLHAYVETQGILLQLVSRFLSPDFFRHPETGKIPEKILDTISYIQLNLNKELTVAHLASRINQHVDYFSRQFLLYTGERPINFIHDKRIERAQYLIVTTRMTFATVAEQTGFETLAYFNRVFKRITGMSPGEYKKQSESYKLYDHR